MLDSGMIQYLNTIKQNKNIKLKSVSLGHLWKNYFLCFSVPKLRPSFRIKKKKHHMIHIFRPDVIWIYFNSRLFIFKCQRTFFFFFNLIVLFSKSKRDVAFAKIAEQQSTVITLVQLPHNGNTAGFKMLIVTFYFSFLLFGLTTYKQKGVSSSLL